MKLYPVLLDMQGQLGVVVGAGPVGCRKARSLLGAGAQVRMVTISPPVDRGLLALAEIRRKAFSVEDLAGARLVFAATGDRATDQTVLHAAHRHGCLANLATKPSDGDFHLPAVLSRGDLMWTFRRAGIRPASRV